ncbi:hypothetical protein [Luteimonas vadosa]|uniref:hypothetical protein n=1 Tax=Luteimonas vadosa TaxID=1165507 RepID=UPI0031E5811A
MSDEDAGESDIHIGKSEIGYYQSAGKILSAAADGDELALIVQLTVDGDTRLATHEFEIPGSGDTLLSLRPNGQLLIRKRCDPLPGTPSNKSFKPNPHQGGLSQAFGEACGEVALRMVMGHQSDPEALCTRS